MSPRLNRLRTLNGWTLTGLALTVLALVGISLLVGPASRTLVTPVPDNLTQVGHLPSSPAPVPSGGSPAPGSPAPGSPAPSVQPSYLPSPVPSRPPTPWPSASQPVPLPSGDPAPWWPDDCYQPYAHVVDAEKDAQTTQEHCSTVGSHLEIRNALSLPFTRPAENVACTHDPATRIVVCQLLFSGNVEISVDGPFGGAGYRLHVITPER